MTKGAGTRGPRRVQPEYWEQRYRHQHERGTPRPSPQLVDEVAGQPPVTALEAGCGEGGNAVWLAERGWRVTAVDVSKTALLRAREYAAQRGEAAGGIEWVEADLTEWSPGDERFDLVTSHYVHPTTAYADLLARLAAATAPGGTLHVVGHDPDDAHSGAHTSGEVGFRAEDLAATLDADRWDVEVAETRTREVTDGHGHQVTLRDAVVRARRHR